MRTDDRSRSSSGHDVSHSCTPATGPRQPPRQTEQETLQASLESSKTAAMASQLEAKTKAMKLGERIPNTPEGWPQAKIRSTFVEYFQRHAHTHWPSSSVVPHDDPTLLFANAGMNQYKSIFLGASTSVYSTKESRLITHLFIPYLL